MSRLHQIQLQYDAHQDRALLRIRTTDDVEFRFWLTRRYTRLLWAVLLKMVAADDQVSTQADPATKQAVMAFRHEEAVAQADFQTRYEQREAVRPLGDEPLLLARVQLKKHDEAAKADTLVLAPVKGRGVEVNLDSKMVHSVCKLLVEVTEKAQWGLGLTLPRTLAAAVVAADRPEHLN